MLVGYGKQIMHASHSIMAMASIIAQLTSTCLVLLYYQCMLPEHTFTNGNLWLSCSVYKGNFILGQIILPGTCLATCVTVSSFLSRVCT